MQSMKTGRLIAYAVAGVIAGLLAENFSLRLRNKAAKKMRTVKNDVTEKVKQVAHHAH